MGGSPTQFIGPPEEGGGGGGTPIGPPGFIGPPEEQPPAMVIGPPTFIGPPAVDGGGGAGVFGSPMPPVSFDGGPQVSIVPAPPSADGVMNSNTNATVPTGVPVTPSSTSVAPAAAGSATNRFGNFLSTIEADALDVVTNPARHLVFIGIVLVLGYFWFFKRKRR